MSKDKLLFTPGPLTTSRTVKEAMLTDLGSRDAAFIRLVREIREELVSLAGVSTDHYTAIPLQGSGTMGVEAVLATGIPPNGKLLVASNGAYGHRIATLARTLKIEVELVAFEEHEKLSPAIIAGKLASDAAITHVAVVHCETTTGVFNPIEEIGPIVQKTGRVFFVDAMSSFGAVPLNIGTAGIDYLVSSANKCIEGVPGFSFVIAKKATIEKTQGWARSVTFDLLDQMRGLDKTGQFRFTPPTHSLIAFRQAIRELREEGSVEGRSARYRGNTEIILSGMQRLGFVPFLKREDSGYIINSFRYPTHPNWNFERFYTALSDKGYVIYPGKVSNAECFRIGNIGRLFAGDMTALLGAIETTLVEMNITLDQEAA